jgi:hypothetical protein
MNPLICPVPVTVRDAGAAWVVAGGVVGGCDGGAVCWPATTADPNAAASAARAKPYANRLELMGIS